MNKSTAWFLMLIVIVLSSCRKADSISSEIYTPQGVVKDFAVYVGKPQYADFEQKALLLQNAVYTLSSTPNAQNLLLAQEAWIATRKVWELSESWAWGPVADNEIDPRIDTWPMDVTQLETVLATSSAIVINSITVNGFEDSLRGFHPLEYILFGVDKRRVYTELDTRNLQYAIALAEVLYGNIQELNSLFNVYSTNLDVFGTQQTFFSEHDALYTIASGMLGICDELANSKMQIPISEMQKNGKDPSLFEESQYAQNTLVDFYHNLLGISNVYNGKYNDTGCSMSDLVRGTNIALDNKIKEQILSAMSAMQALDASKSYGEHVKNNLTQVQRVQTIINSLGQTLEMDLIQGFISSNYKK